MKNMLKITIAGLAATMALGANAAQVGSYAGAGVGYGRVTTPKDNVAVGRVFAGYNVTNQFGMELGFDRTSTAEKSKNVAVGNVQKDKSHFSIVDLVGKGYYEVAPKTDLFALGGLAYVTETFHDTNSLVSSVTSGTTHYFRPELGVGASYAVTEQVAVSGDYRYILGNEGLFSSHYRTTPALHLVTVALAYNFG